MAKGPFLCTVISGHVLTSGGGKVRRQQVRKARPHEQGRNITKPENKTARDLYRMGELSSLQSAGETDTTDAKKAAEAFRADQVGEMGRICREILFCRHWLFLQCYRQLALRIGMAFQQFLLIKSVDFCALPCLRRDRA